MATKKPEKAVTKKPEKAVTKDAPKKKKPTYETIDGQKFVIKD